MGILKTTKKKHTMKVAFFAAALIGMTSAVSYERMLEDEFNLAQIDDLDFEDYDDFNFAQIDSHTDADACEEVVNGLKVRLNTPECKEEKKVPFESAVMD